MMKTKLKSWFDNIGLISIVWITVSIIVFEILFLTTSLERRDFFFNYILITMSVPIVMYGINQYRIRVIRKKNRVKLHRFFDVIKIEIKTKEFKNFFLMPLEEIIPINMVEMSQQSEKIVIKIGLIETITIEFDQDKATISIDELPIRISHYYKRVRKTDDWNSFSNYRMLGTKKLYEDMLHNLKDIVHYGCVIEEYHIDSKHYRIVGFINNVNKTKIFDSISPFDKKNNKSNWFKAKPKGYKISFK